MWHDRRMADRGTAATTVQRWSVGDATITSVVEAETHHIPPEFFFPGVTAADLQRQPWLVPDYVDADGNIGLRVQAVVIEVAGRRVLVDPCVGNGKTRQLPFWNEMTWPFLERFADAGFTPESIDTVVHTHLHADHVGWATHRVDGEWAPMFTQARHLYTERELAYSREVAGQGAEDVYGDSVAPPTWPTSWPRTRTWATGCGSNPDRPHARSRVALARTGWRAGADHRRLPAPPGPVHRARVGRGRRPRPRPGPGHPSPDVRRRGDERRAGGGDALHDPPGRPHRGQRRRLAVRTRLTRTAPGLPG